MNLGLPEYETNRDFSVLILLKIIMYISEPVRITNCLLLKSEILLRRPVKLNTVSDVITFISDIFFEGSERRKRCNQKFV